MRRLPRRLVRQQRAESLRPGSRQVRAGHLRHPVGLPPRGHRVPGRRHLIHAGLHTGHQAREVAAGSALCRR